MAHKEWITVNRPGYLGKTRDEKFQQWNSTFGQNNWRLAWKYDGKDLSFINACFLYEQSYYYFFLYNRSILTELVTTASDVYDDHPSNVQSEINYLKQETVHTHIQDIAIRRSVFRHHQNFQGNELLQIRQEIGDHSLSVTLSPGKVPFHHPSRILKPQLIGWWDKNSVESFYQSNRVLQIKAALPQLRPK